MVVLNHIESAFYYCKCIALPFATWLGSYHCVKSAFSCPTAIKLSHKTLFVQGNTCHLRAAALTASWVSTNSLALPFGSRMAYPRCCLLLVAWIQEWRDMGNHQLIWPVTKGQREGEIIPCFLSPWISELLIPYEKLEKVN